MHGKDGLPTGALRAIAERTAELADSADVLVANHVRSTRRTAAREARDFFARASRAAVRRRPGAPPAPRLRGRPPLAAEGERPVRSPLR
ncbi:hypothetical protein ACFQ0G_30850 [Streptomyces chiangmaiensis]